MDLSTATLQDFTYSKPELLQVAGRKLTSASKHKYIGKANNTITNTEEEELSEGLVSVSSYTTNQFDRQLSQGKHG